MKNHFRLITLVIIVIFTASLVSGCNNNASSGDSTSSVSTSTSNSSSSTANAGQNEEKKSWQIDTSPFKLDWYIGLATYNQQWDSENVILQKMHKEDTGLTDINFIVTANESNVKLNALIASNDVPDVITLIDATGKGQSQVNTLIDNDLVYDLKELSEEYAPDFIKRVSPILLNWHTRDGKFYYFPNSVTTPDRVDPETMASFGTNLGIIARKDIMDQVGLTNDDFKTKEGFIAALKKVKDAHIKYNGVEIMPFVYNGTFAGDGIEFISQLFGLSYEDQAGNYVMGYKNPKFVEMLKFMNRLYREGLLTDENFMMNQSTIAENVANGKVFMVFGNAGEGAFGNSIKGLYLDSKGASQFVGVGPIAPDDGSLPKVKDKMLNGWLKTFISKSTKIPERIIRLFDYFSTDESVMLDMYGVEGEHYNLVNGKVVYTDKVKETIKKDPLLTNSLYGFPNVMIFFRGAWIRKYDPLPVEPADIMVKEMSKFYARYQYPGDAVTIAATPGTPEAVISAKINLELLDQLPKMVMAKSEQECMNLYNNTMTKVDGLGFNQLYELFNTKYQENKKKLGDSLK